MKLRWMVLLTTAACGCTGRNDRTDIDRAANGPVQQTCEGVSLTIRPVVETYRDGQKAVEIAIEFQNNSSTPKTFILPQDCSYWDAGYPRYAFAITNQSGTALRRVFMLDAPEPGDIDQALRTLQPHESLYVMAHRIPFDIPDDENLTLSLTYSAHGSRERYHERAKFREPLPASLCVGTVASAPTRMDLSLPAPKRHPADPVAAESLLLKRRFDPPAPIAVTASPVRLRRQQWTDIYLAEVRLTIDPGADLPADGWALDVTWYDHRNQGVPSYRYDGDNYWARYSLPSNLRLRDSMTLQEIPLGFQKDVGHYKVVLSLTLQGKQMASASPIEIEIFPNPQLQGTNTSPPVSDSRVSP